ncbi:MAG: CDP-diacylglycerol--glycerol-3-phosphate 3-phosphatidyltransferase [Nitrospirota bacterium]
MVNLPNALTLIRILIIPLFILLLLSPTPEKEFLAAVIFSIASLTDWLDGFIARKSSKVTKLGMILDPIADKLLIAAALILLVDMLRIPAWMAVVIIGRELAVSGLRAVALSKDIVIPAESGGKYKMVTQIVAVLFLLLGYEIYGISFLTIGMIALWISMIFGIISGIGYFVSFWRQA